MDEWKNRAPKLSKIKKETPFRTPDNYFDDFSARLQMKIQSEKEVLPEGKNRIIRLLKPVLSLAASFVLIFLLVYWPLNEFMDNQVAETATEESEITDDEYLSLVESIDEESFYALLEQTDTQEQLSDEELIDYIDNNISEYDIYLGTE